MVSYNKLSDAELVSLFKEGDETAYLEIYDRYKTLLLHHAYKKLGNLQDVDDILQELFTDLWNKRDRLPFTSNLSGYLYTAVRNRIFNLFYRRQREVSHLESLASFAEAGAWEADQLLLEKELSLLIEKEIRELSPRVREVFTLSRDQGLSHREIALQLGTSEQTVSKQISQALKMLKVRLGKLLFLILLLFS
ncbi:MAG TPA: RNA polymerase sigma-70 factor [Anseongella sp.]